MTEFSNYFKMTFQETKIIFNKLAISDWSVIGSIGKESGQATVLEVARKSDNKKGVFRYLKRKNEIDIKRFNREVEILTNEKHKHPNIVNILIYSIDEHWYISEKGDSFKNHWRSIKKKHRNNPDQILQIAISYLKKIIAGLNSLHNEKVVHRDIKIDNIIISNNEPVLIDFGLVYNPEEERITDVDSAVGNARFSPDQMMNRLEEVPPWLDIFQLSQLLIWMVAEKPSKDWIRPLDWRWVIYPAKMSDENVLSVKAITAICSDPFVSPSNAMELDSLIDNLLTFDYNISHSDSNVNNIIQSIKNGKAKSVISSSEDLAIFNSSYPIFVKFYLQIESHIKGLSKMGNGSLPLKFEEKEKVDIWVENVRNIIKFESNQENYPYELYCGERSQSYFCFSTANIFIVPSQAAIIGGDYLPKEYLPIYMEFGINSNNNLLIQMLSQRQIFVAIDNKGQLWYSKLARDFNATKQPISINEILDIFSTWIQDVYFWEAINM